MWINYSDFYTLDPLPDELFYSTISRTARLLNHRHLYEISVYFKQKTSKPTSVIPVHNYKDPMTVFKHCVTSYYMASFTLERQKTLLNHIFFSKKPKFTGIFRTGNYSVFKKSAFSYCPCCLKEDLDKFGIPYFHLSHQYEGVKACARHKTQLLVYKSNRKIFPLLKPDDYRDPKEADARDILYSSWALDFHNFSHEYLSMIYKSQALKRNVDLFNKQKLYKQLEEYFGFDFMYQCNCSIEQLSSDNQKILGLFNPKGDSTHPYYHFMVWEFLDLTPKDFIDSIFALKEEKLFLAPQSVDLSALKVLEEDLGKRVCFSESLGKEFVEFFPIDLKKYIESR